MGGFNVDADEMPALTSALTSVGDTLNGVVVPPSPGVGALGALIVHEAATDFTTAATTRIEGLARWCANTAIHVADTSRHTQATDQEWADELTRTLKSDQYTYQ